MLKKVTTGFVIQDFDEKTGKCVSQKFIAGNIVNWGNDSGDWGIDHPSDEKFEYFPFDMVQPE